MKAGRKVYLDVTILQHTRDARGIGQVTLQLIRLFARNPEFRGVHFISSAGVDAGILHGLGVDKDRVVEIPLVPALSRHERFHGLLCDPRYLAVRRSASLIIHSECRTALWSRIPQAILFYDFMSFGPATAGAARKWDRELYFRYKYWKAARAGGWFVTISEHTRRQALALYPFLDPARVTCLHLGIRSALARPSDGRRPPDFSEVRFLYVGSCEPRKNVPRLIERFGEVSRGRPSRLDVVGNLSPGQRRDLEARRSALARPEEIVLHGKVDDARLARFYAEAHVLLFPSHGEGFGLPVVEAMRSGLVVCAFANTTLPEIGGEVLLLARDDDFAAWGAQLDPLFRDPALFMERAERSRERADYFSEERMFERYGAYFRRLMDEAGAGGTESGHG